MNAMTYKASGRIAPAFFPLFILFMIIGIPLVSMAYVYMIFYIPSIYLNIFVTGACGAALGVLMLLAVKFGKARNTAVVMVLTVVSAVVMSYVQWIIYIPLVLSEVFGLTASFAERLEFTLHLLVNPQETFDFIASINEVGVWTVEIAGEIELYGTLLTIVWILEFALMAGVAMLVASIQSKTPFSENANNWYVEQKGVIQTDAVEDRESLKTDLGRGELTKLIELIEVGKTNDANFMTVTVHEPPSDASDDPFIFDIKEHSVNETKRKSKTKIEDIIKGLLVDANKAREITAKAATVTDPKDINQAD